VTEGVEQTQLLGPDEVALHEIQYRKSLVRTLFSRPERAPKTLGEG
jgi:hypothetical protein